MGKWPIQFVTLGWVSISTEEYIKQKPRLEEVFKEKLENEKLKRKNIKEIPVPTVKIIQQRDVEDTEVDEVKVDDENVSENIISEEKEVIEDTQEEIKPKKKGKRWK